MREDERDGDLTAFDQGLVRHNRGSRMTAGDNTISGKSAAEEALARLSPHRTHESNDQTGLSSALRSWTASPVPSDLDRFAPPRESASAAGALRSGCHVSECSQDFQQLSIFMKQ
jgi:hypothetical protein